MTDVVEVFWNARPHLERLGLNLNPKRRDIDPRGEQLLDEVRRSLVHAFPESATLVRIAVRTGVGQADLRVVRRGVEEPDRLDELRDLVDDAVGRAAPQPA